MEQELDKCVIDRIKSIEYLDLKETRGFFAIPDMEVPHSLSEGVSCDSKIELIDLHF